MVAKSADMRAKSGDTNMTDPNGTVQDLLEAAAKEEGQGERWRVDTPKSLRRYDEARKLAERAAALYPGDATASAEAGRLNYLLATTFDGSNAALNRLATSIKYYRRSYAIDRAYDSAFNLAQALSTMGDMLEEGSTASPVEYWEEALSIYPTVESLQREAMSSQGVDFSRDAEEDGDMQTESSSGDVSVEVGELVTPSNIIDTILARLDVDLDLYSVSESPERRTSIWSDVVECVVRARELDTEGFRAVDIATAEAEAMLSRSKSDAERSGDDLNVRALATCCETLSNLAEAEETVSSLTISADSASTAVELILRHDRSEEARYLSLKLLSQAWKAYEESIAMLEAPMLSRHVSVRAMLPNEIPPTISKALCSLANLTLTLAAVQTQPDGVRPTLEGSVALARRAFQAVSGREDWASQSARKSAALCMCRTGAVEGEDAGKVLKESGVTFEDVTNFIQEVEGDAVWSSTGGGEAEMWRSLARSLA